MTIYYLINQRFYKQESRTPLMKYDFLRLNTNKIKDQNYAWCAKNSLMA